MKQPCLLSLHVQSLDVGVNRHFVYAFALYVASPDCGDNVAVIKGCIKPVYLMPSFCSQTGVQDIQRQHCQELEGIGDGIVDQGDYTKQFDNLDGLLAFCEKAIHEQGDIAKASDLEPVLLLPKINGIEAKLLDLQLLLGSSGVAKQAGHRAPNKLPSVTTVQYFDEIMYAFDTLFLPQLVPADPDEQDEFMHDFEWDCSAEGGHNDPRIEAELNAKLVLRNMWLAKHRELPPTT